MSTTLQNATPEHAHVFLARESFIGELKTLDRHYPKTGFGVSLHTHSGEHYLLANAKMPLPGKKSDGFPTGRRVACLENGKRFRSIEVLADTHEDEAFNPQTEAEMLSDVLELIAQIEGPSGLPVGRRSTHHHVASVATGTGG
ncbi:hypothetical protein [Ruegeria sp. HKCCD8929]|uniref:hypothetical protein n=1 Tax=Ruegeria sp. HKCCD8929 TaxID=2683006 RepID=UPI001487F865